MIEPIVYIGEIMARCRSKIACKRHIAYTDPDELGYDRGYKGMGVEEIPIDRSKLSLRDRRFGDLGNSEDDIKDWKMRKYIDNGVLPPVNLRKKKSTKPKLKKCKCKK